MNELAWITDSVFNKMQHLIFAHGCALRVICIAFILKNWILNFSPYIKLRRIYTLCTLFSFLVVQQDLKVLRYSDLVDFLSGIISKILDKLLPCLIRRILRTPKKV